MKQNKEMTLHDYKERSKKQGIYPNVVLSFDMLEALLRTEIKRIVPEKEKYVDYSKGGNLDMTIDLKELDRNTVDAFNNCIDQITENMEKELGK